MNWPKPDQLIEYYGNPDINGDGLPDPIWERDNIVRIAPPYPMVLAWDTRRDVSRIAVHKKCEKSLRRILTKIAEEFSAQERAYHQLDRFGGCYNFRLMRGSNRLSVHSYGAAIDLAPELNGLGVKYKPNSRMMPMKVIRIFESEGWGWGGEWHRPDAMHFEAVE